MLILNAVGLQIRPSGKWETIRNGRKPFFNSQYPGDKNLKPGTAKFEYKHTLF